MEKIGIVGAGNMGEAMIKGIISSGGVERKNICVSDKRPKRLNYIKTTYGASPFSSNIQVVEESSTVILCVKPQDVNGLLSEIRDSAKGKLIISIAAGIATDFIEKHLTTKTRVVRVMPNTPALVNEGFSCFTGGESSTAADLEATERILSGIGMTMEVKEELMDVVTAISGNGPAYFFYLIEALMDVALERGFKKEEALRMCTYTALGSAKLLESSGEKPEVLRKRVTSPGGTTEAAMEVFNKRRFKEIIKEALASAIRRSEELRQK